MSDFQILQQLNGLESISLPAKTRKDLLQLLPCEDPQEQDHELQDTCDYDKNIRDLSMAMKRKPKYQFVSVGGSVGGNFTLISSNQIK